MVNSEPLIVNAPVQVNEMGKTSPYPVGRMRSSGWDCIEKRDLSIS